MKNKRQETEERRGRTMRITEAKGLSLEDFEMLDDDYSGFDAESTKNHPIRDEEETFMQFIKKGSEKVKLDPAVQKILG